jgi:hypothetical protein
VQPVGEAQSKTGWVRAVYRVIGPVIPLLKRAFPDYVTTTQEMGRAMLVVARDGFDQRVLENRDIARASRSVR